MRDHDDIKELVNEAEQEHTEVKVLLEQMKSLDATSSEFKEKISTLKEAVQHHVQEEENEVFPKVRQSMSDEELKQLAKEFEETQSKLQQDLSVATRWGNTLSIAEAENGSTGYLVARSWEFFAKTNGIYQVIPVSSCWWS